MCIFDLKQKKNRFNEKLTDLTHISLHRSVWILPSSKRHHGSDFLVVTDSIKMHQKLLCTGSCLKVLKGVIRLKGKTQHLRSPQHRMLIGRGYYLNLWKNRVIVFIQLLKMSPAATNNWELIFRLFNEIKLIHHSQSVHQYL